MYAKLISNEEARALSQNTQQQQPGSSFQPLEE